MKDLRFTGSGTLAKQSHFTQLLQTHLLICKGIRKRKDYADPVYRYFDLNAGTGYAGLNCYGSTMRFLNAAYDYVKTPFHAYFLENDSARVKELQQNVQEFEFWSPEIGFEYKVNIIPGDNEKTLPKILEPFHTQQKAVYGLMYSDPPGEVPPFRLLRKAMEPHCFRTLDVLIYLSATNLKRFRCHEKCTFDTYLLDALQSVGKRFIIVREPMGRHQWTFALLTNWDKYPEFKDKGFHRADSAMGKEIMKRLNYTAKELERNPDPFGDED